MALWSRFISPRRVPGHSPIQPSPGVLPFMLGMRALACAALAAFAGLLMANAAYAQSQAYSDGLADRTAYENWFATLSGQEKAGAEYWAGQRSLPNPSPCTPQSGNSDAAWVAGCREAQRLLAPSDARRHSEAEYRLGWNAFQGSPPAVVDTPQTPPPRPPPAFVRHPVVRDTAILAAGGQTFMLDGVRGFGAPYADQLQSYLAANGDSISCKPQGAPGYYVCVLADGTDIAKAALLNGAARATPDAPPSYREQEAAAQAAGRGIWGSLPPSPPSARSAEPSSLTPETPAPTSETETVLAQWSGQGIMTTRPFHMDKEWELQWTASGLFSIHLVTIGSDDTTGELIANQVGGSSTSFVPRGGDYYLRIDATDQWSLRAVSVPPTGTDNAATNPAGRATPTQTTVPAESGLGVPSRAMHTTTQPVNAASASMPDEEATVIEATKAAMVQYANGQNDMQKGAARPMRAQARAVPDQVHTYPSYAK